MSPLCGATMRIDQDIRCLPCAGFFLLIIAFVTRSDPVSLVVKIGSRGKWCFWYSISITKHDSNCAGLFLADFGHSQIPGHS